MALWQQIRLLSITKLYYYYYFYCYSQMPFYNIHVEFYLQFLLSVLVDKLPVLRTQ